MIARAQPFLQSGSLATLLSPRYFAASLEGTWRPFCTLTYMLDAALSMHPAMFKADRTCSGTSAPPGWSWRSRGASCPSGHRRYAIVAGLFFALHPVTTETVDNASFREDALVDGVHAGDAAVRARRPSRPGARELRPRPAVEGIGGGGPRAARAHPRRSGRGSAAPAGRAWRALLRELAPLRARRGRLPRRPLRAHEDADRLRPLPRRHLLGDAGRRCPRSGPTTSGCCCPLAAVRRPVGPLRFRSPAAAAVRGRDRGRARLPGGASCWRPGAASAPSRSASAGSSSRCCPSRTCCPIPIPAAERFLYLPLAGIALAVAAAFGLLAGAARLRGAPARCSAGGVAVLGVYVVLVNVRHADWRDDESLWRATIATNPLLLRRAERGRRPAALPRDGEPRPRAAARGGRAPADRAVALRRRRRPVPRRHDLHPPRRRRRRCWTTARRRARRWSRRPASPRATGCRSSGSATSPTSKGTRIAPRPCSSARSSISGRPTATSPRSPSSTSTRSDPARQGAGRN